jgi:hypothetical protein
VKLTCSSRSRHLFRTGQALQAMSTQAQTNGVPEKQSNALERVHSIPFISEVRLPQLACPTLNAALDRLPPRRAAAQDLPDGCHLRPCRGLVRRLRQAWPGAAAFGIRQRLRQQVPRVCLLSTKCVADRVCSYVEAKYPKVFQAHESDVCFTTLFPLFSNAQASSSRTPASPPTQRESPPPLCVQH